LPSQIHRDHPLWVPPIYWDEWHYFNPKKNKAFEYCDTILALAWQNGKPVGRIMGIVNHRYNASRGERTGRFAYLECWNDPVVCHALLQFVEDWARELGMNRMVGLLGFSDQDPEGFLIEGFEYEPTLATYYNHAYMIPLLEAEGYTKDVDYVVYKVIPHIPEFYRKVHSRISRQKEFKLLEFESKKGLKPFIRPVLELMNETFRDFYGYLPLDDEEMTALGKKYLPILDPRFIKIIVRGEEVVAFIIGIPNLNEGIRRAGGHLFPFGIFQIMRAAKRSKQLDLMLGAIKPEYRGRGLDVLLGMATIGSAIRAGIEVLDSHHELETNTRVRAEMEKMGGQVYKRFRVFQKPL